MNATVLVAFRSFWNVEPNLATLRSPIDELTSTRRHCSSHRPRLRIEAKHLLSTDESVEFYERKRKIIM